MQNTVRAVIGYDQSVRGYDMARYRGQLVSPSDAQGSYRDEGGEDGD
jgi:hypothetical protein